MEDQIPVAPTEAGVARPPAVRELHAEQKARTAAAVVPEEPAEPVLAGRVLGPPGTGSELEGHARRVGLHPQQRDRDVRRPDEQPVHRQRRRQLVLRPAHASLEVEAVGTVAVAEGGGPHGAEPVGPAPARQPGISGSSTPRPAAPRRSPGPPRGSASARAGDQVGQRDRRGRTGSACAPEAATRNGSLARERSAICRKSPGLRRYEGRSTRRPLTRTCWWVTNWRAW